MVASMHKKSRFRGCVEKQRGKCPQTLLKFEGEPFYHIYLSLGSQLSYKKSLSAICKISKLFPNTLSADGSEFFSSFLKCSLNFEHFQKRVTLLADVSWKLGTPKNMVTSMPKKSRFRASVEKQRAKCAQTSFKFEGHLLYHIY